MHCEEVKKNLSFYLEGLIDGKEAVQIEEHLSICQNCRLVLEEERIFLSFLRDHMTPPPAPAHLKSRVREMLRARRKTKKYWFWVLPPAVASAIITVFIFACDWTAQSEWAVSTHLAAKNDSHLLDVRSGHPAILKEWASRKTNLPLRIVPILPAEIQIQGGRVISDKGDHIVQVTYSGGKETSSLYAMPKERIHLYGHGITLNGLTFHVQKVNGHFTVAWESTQAGYVMVSETEQGINRGCLLCHSNETMQLPPSAFLIES